MYNLSAQSRKNKDNAQHRKFNTLMAFIAITNMTSVNFVNAAPTLCKPTCRGECKESFGMNGTTIIANNSTSLINDFSTKDLIDSVIDGETAEERKQLVDGQTQRNVSQSDAKREKRASYVERRTCSSRFQLEIIVIPVSIMMIPVALCSLLLCVFCCGPKDSRGKIPEKMFGVQLSQSCRKSKADSEADELEYGDGYVQRKDSKKTRFDMNVQVFEMSLNSRKCSTVATILALNVKASTGKIDDTVKIAQSKISNSEKNFESKETNAGHKNQGMLMKNVF